MNTKTTNYFLFFVSIALIIQGCKKDKDKSNWLTNWVFPIAQTTIGINSLVPDSLRTVNDDGSVNLSYVTNLNTINTNDLIVIPDTTILNRISIPFGSFLVNPGADVFQKTEVINFNSSSRLTRAILKSGKLIYTIKNYTNGILDINYIVPDAKLNEVGINLNKTIPKKEANVPGISSGEIDLSGYSLKLTGLSNLLTNQITSYITAKLSSNSPATTITMADSLVLSFTFSKLVPTYARGNFAPQIFNAEGETDVNIFEPLQGGNFDFDKLSLSLVLENGIGADVKAKLDNFKVSNSQTNQSLNLNHSLVGANLNLARATENPYTPTRKYFILDETNSNALDFLDVKPNKISYTIQGELNPLGNISNLNDFVYSDKLIKALIDLKIPLNFSAEKITLSDTTSFSWPIDEKREPYINKIKIKMLAKNQIPLGCRISLLFLDENKKLIKEKLSNGDILAAEQVQGSSQTISATSTIITTISKEEYPELKKTKFIAWKTEFNTYNLPQKNTWYSNYTLKINTLGTFEYRMHL
jgi:hypothetical protein